MSEESSLSQKALFSLKENSANFSALTGLDCAMSRRVLEKLNALDSSFAKKAVQLISQDRKTSLKTLSPSFGRDVFKILEKNWSAYRKKIKPNKGAIELPESIENVVSTVNQWPEGNTFF